MEGPESASCGTPIKNAQSVPGTRLKNAVARSLDHEKYAGQPVRDELRANLSARAEGFYQGTTLGGVPATAFFSRVPGTEWSVLIGVPQAARMEGPDSAACGTPISTDHSVPGTRLKNAVAGTPPSVVPW